MATRRGFGDADDIAAVLHDRLTKTVNRRPASAAKTSGRGPTPRLIVGLIPEATGPMHPDMRHALNQRKRLIERRAKALAEQAVAEESRWIGDLGPQPVGRRLNRVWLREAAVVAAYRDLHAVTGHRALGAVPSTDNQRRDQAHARAALAKAQQASTADRAHRDAGPARRSYRPGPRL